MFKKRTFTLSGFGRSLIMNAVYSPRLIAALIKPATSSALREQVMLGCTSVNDCRYCDWVHTRLALENSVNVEELNQFLSNPEGVTLPHDIAIAVLYAQHFAEQQTQASPDAYERLKSTFSTWQRLEIEAYLHAIYFANLTGNTFDALLSRLQGEPKENSSLATELLVALAGAPVLLSIAHQARKINDPRFTFLTTQE